MEVDVQDNGISRQPKDPQVSRERDQVVLVHGTFSSSPEDNGEAWWQVGSATYEQLQQKLPSNTSLATEGRVFRWSGENNERARSKAAVELLDHLAELETEGRGYHLIGHSHGGSVIWAALRLAAARKKSLDALRSWSTVGTPFLHHRSRSPWNLVNIVYMVLAAVLLIPASQTCLLLAQLPFKIASGKLDQGIMMSDASEAGFVTSVVRAPIVRMMEFSGVTFTKTSEGIRLGSYNPESGQTVSEFLFGTFEGWLVIAGIILFAYVTLLFGSWFVSPVLESLRIRFEHRLEQRAMRKFGHRWLGIWSRDDEAINGLRATLDLSISFVGKLAPRERIFFSDSISLLSRPYFWILAPIYNWLIRPVLDTLIRGFVVRTAQGNNRPAAQIVAVGPGPLAPPDAPEVPEIPHWISTRLLDEANQYAGDMGPKFRQLLAEPSFTAGLDNFGRQLVGRELVHTSYFAHDEVIDLVAANIYWSQQPTDSQYGLKSDRLLEWFNGFKLLFDHTNSSVNRPVDSRDTPANEQDTKTGRAA